jgi:hypothetical protein
MGRVLGLRDIALHYFINNPAAPPKILMDRFATIRIEFVEKK